MYNTALPMYNIENNDHGESQILDNCHLDVTPTAFVRKDQINNRQYRTIHTIKQASILRWTTADPAHTIIWSSQSLLITGLRVITAGLCTSSSLVDDVRLINGLALIARCVKLTSCR